MIKKNAGQEISYNCKGKVLLMDDEQQVRDGTSRMLKQIGYEAYHAKDGAEAIILYKTAQKSRQPFDAVILDLNIPGGMGGDEAIKKLIELDPNIKAIISSGDINNPVMANSRKYGFSGALSKPYNISELKNTLDEVMLRLDNLTVLIATRDIDLKVRLIEILISKGHQPVVVENCKYALLKLLDYEIDLVIFDPDLTEMDGADTVEIIKKIQPQLPIVVTSDNTTFETGVKIAKVGVYFRMSKPIDEQIIEELFKIVEKKVNKEKTG